MFATRYFAEKAMESLGKKSLKKPLISLTYLARSGLFLILCLGTFCSFLTAGRLRYASLLMDMSSGRILHQIGANQKIYPASLTKMMTLYLVFDAVRRGQLRLDQKVRTSAYAAGKEAKRLGLRKGERLTVRQAVLSLVCHSANDSAVVLAEAVAGSEQAFARRMTAKARQLGMRHTLFRNATGLFHACQFSTAQDMARLAVSLIRHFPKEYAFFKRTKFTYRGRHYGTTNKLVGQAGVDGLKTGYINRSGFNLVSSAKRGRTRLIGVVIGGKSSQWRNIHMASLLEMGFDKRASLMQASLKPKAGKDAGSLLRMTSFSGEPLHKSEPKRNKKPLIKKTRAKKHTAQAARPIKLIRKKNTSALRQASLKKRALPASTSHRKKSSTYLAALGRRKRKTIEHFLAKKA